MSNPWVVLKFGGTSVATLEGWRRVYERTLELQETSRIWIVASALSQVSNRLERAIDDALQSVEGDSLSWILDAHRNLATDAGVSPAAFAPVAELFEELERLLAGIRMTREASPRLRARVMSFGELASTHLGIAILQEMGISAARVDAREILQSVETDSTPMADRFLSAEVPVARGGECREWVADDDDVVLTQGFIARTPRGETCLLGRGGSDTSAALFAAWLRSPTLEIWTDVHGLFSADPHQLPGARLIRHASYREAQELAAMGAKVLHPRCLLPAAVAETTVHIRNTRDPESPGTKITRSAGDEPAVMAVVHRKRVTLVSITTLAMWGTSGFLAKVFAPFEQLGISVDLVATSQSNVTVTLDHIPEGVSGEPFTRLVSKLRELGDVTVLPACAVVSVVGRKIRAVLHRLGPAFEAFEEHQVHMVSESSEDLNLSFVVDESAASKLVATLHGRLLPKQGYGELFGPSWEELMHGGDTALHHEVGRQERWWQNKAKDLIALVSDGHARFVYDLSTVRSQARQLKSGLTSVAGLYYATKANGHPEILHILAEEGFGMECVSAAEVEWVREHLGADVPVLFTPNFCPVEEYALGFELGAEVTLDGPEVLLANPEVFAGREVALRVDPGGGLGHHEKVVTAGAHAKFGHPARELQAVVDAAARVGAVVVGLHAHVGSGILNPDAWAPTASLLGELAASITTLRWIDVGGGLGVVERAGQAPLDLARLQESLAAIKSELGDVELRMEPGRYLVSEAGVLLTPVTQVRRKGEVSFVGVSTGMNSLIRPALYGAWHGIHNLTRLGSSGEGYHHVVGPICETGDVLGRDRLLPPTSSGDVLLIENCGAYGAVMSSSYNRRAPATEVVLPIDPV